MAVSRQRITLGYGVGLAFPNQRGNPLCKTSLLRRSCIPSFGTLGLRKQGFYGMRSTRLTYLRKQQVPRRSDFACGLDTQQFCNWG